jgi:hypothetical protein
VPRAEALLRPSSLIRRISVAAVTASSPAKRPGSAVSTAATRLMATLDQSDPLAFLTIETDTRSVSSALATMQGGSTSRYQYSFDLPCGTRNSCSS